MNTNTGRQNPRSELDEQLLLNNTAWIRLSLLRLHVPVVHVLFLCRRAFALVAWHVGRARRLVVYECGGADVRQVWR